MFASISELESQALQLPPAERVRLANRLLTSLSDDSSVDEAWGLEVARRLAELDSGAVEPVPDAEAMARARAAIKARR